MESQMTIFDVIEESQLQEAVSQNPKRWEDLTVSDYVEVWWSNGLHFAGWIVAARNDRHVKDQWEIEPEWVERHGVREYRRPWAEVQKFQGIRFMHLSSQDLKWRWVRHDEEYALHPTRDELEDWLSRRLATIQPSSAAEAFHVAQSLWPISMSHQVSDLYCQAMLNRWPDIRGYLADKKLTRYPLPKTAKDEIRKCAAFSGEERLAALRKVHWDIKEGAAWHLSLRHQVTGNYLMHWLTIVDDPDLLVSVAALFGHQVGRCDHGTDYRLESEEAC